tara:strand:- start:5654 stop:5836 length:183 start_codon:yes stop_codon:yes gene_type:complete
MGTALGWLDQTGSFYHDGRVKTHLWRTGQKRNFARFWHHVVEIFNLMLGVDPLLFHGAKR